MSVFAILTAAVEPVAPPIDAGLTLAEILDDLPTDPASIFAIVLLLGFFGFMLWIGRGRPGGTGGTPATPA